MRTKERMPGPPRTTEAELLIEEARRRQRRRWGISAVVVVVVLIVGAIALGNRGTSPRPHANPPGPPPMTRPLPVLKGIDARVLLWPVGAPSFGPSGGPDAYVDDLSTGRLSQHEIGISAGDFEPLLVQVGGSLVYVGNGTTTLSDDLDGTPRVLGSTPFFAPSAETGHVWLSYYPARSGPVTVRSVALSGGLPGRPIRLPEGSELIEGTRAGFLLFGSDGGLELWSPGGHAAALPHSASLVSAIGANRDAVAYGSGCRDEETAAGNRFEPDAGFEECSMLRVLDLVTGRLASFPAPAGSAGWIPNQFAIGEAISPDDDMIAAEALVGPTAQGRIRLFVVRLGSHHPETRLVPRSTASLFARTAWSPDGSWLFYEGPGVHLWAYRVADGATKSSTTPCCRYTVMVALPR